MKNLEMVFETVVDIPRIKVGKKQTVDTLINEEAMMLAKFVRDELKVCIP